MLSITPLLSFLQLFILLFTSLIWFKNVFIINCYEDNLPHISGAGSSVEEERRIFYVAVTRAIENLFISSPYFILGEEKRQSRFIDEGKINKG